MNVREITKPVVLTGISVTTSLAVGVLLYKAADRFAPKLVTKLEADDFAADNELRETIFKLVQYLGVTVVVTLVAGFVAQAARDKVETLFWYEPMYQIED